MRIAVAVVVGLVLLGSGNARGAEATRERSVICLDDCDLTFDRCRRREGPKGPGRCNVEVVRCKNACPLVTVEEPAVPTAKSRQRCLDACRDVYERCRERPENKAGGRCAANEVRCEQACPDVPEPAPVAATPPEAAEPASDAAAPDEPSTGAAIPPPAAAPPAAAPPSAAPPPPVVAPPAEAPARRAARVEGAAPAAAASGTPATTDAPAPATIRSEASVPPASAPAAPPAAAVRPAQAERGFFAKLGCFFVSCEPAGPSPCVQQCLATYEDCVDRESAKRGGECNARLMRCRQSCSANAASAR